MKNITINISLPEPLLEAADKQAETDLRNRSELIREAVRDYLLKRQITNPTDTFSTDEHKRLDSFINELDSERKWVVLSLAYRPQPNSVMDLFGGNNSAVTKLIEHPGGLRRMGWDLETLDTARPVAGEYLQVTNGIRKILRVYRDGQVLIAGDDQFIGWAVNQEEGNEVFSVNALATSEFLINFVKFGFDLSKYLKEESSKMILTISFHNPKKEKVRLVLVTKDFPLSGRTSATVVNASASEVSISLNENFKLERSAYPFLMELFYLFGLRADEIIYINNETKEINFDYFKDQ